jgi:hypothetical protein
MLIESIFPKEIDIKTTGKACDHDASCDSYRRQYAYCCIAEDAGPFHQLQYAKGTRHYYRQRYIDWIYTEQQSQRNAPKGYMGKSISYK